MGIFGIAGGILRDWFGRNLQSEQAANETGLSASSLADSLRATNLFLSARIPTTFRWPILSF